MPEPIILYAYVPGHRERERAPAIEAVRALSPAYDVRWWECIGDLGYAHGVASVWSHPGDLIIIEEDIAPTPAMIDALFGCSHPACVQFQWASGVAMGRMHPILGSFVGFAPNWRPVTPADSHADHTAIGLVKLKPEARRTPFRISTWRDGVCNEVNDKAKAVGGWHLHGPPVRHYHGFTQKTYDRWAQEEYS